MSLGAAIDERRLSTGRFVVAAVAKRPVPGGAVSGKAQQHLLDARIDHDDLEAQGKWLALSAATLEIGVLLSVEIYSFPGCVANR